MIFCRLTLAKREAPGLNWDCRFWNATAKGTGQTGAGALDGSAAKTHQAPLYWGLSLTRAPVQIASSPQRLCWKQCAAFDKLAHAGLAWEKPLLPAVSMPLLLFYPHTGLSVLLHDLLFLVTPKNLDSTVPLTVPLQGLLASCLWTHMRKGSWPSTSA